MFYSMSKMVTQALKYFPWSINLFGHQIKPKFAFEFEDTMKIHCWMLKTTQIFRT